MTLRRAMLLLGLSVFTTIPSVSFAGQSEAYSLDYTDQSNGSVSSQSTHYDVLHEIKFITAHGDSQVSENYSVSSHPSELPGQSAVETDWNQYAFEPPISGSNSVTSTVSHKSFTNTLNSWLYYASWIAQNSWVQSKFIRFYIPL